MALPTSRSPERLVFVAEAGGVHQIEVFPLEKGENTGKYLLKLSELREGTKDDRHFAAAQKALREASLILSDRKPDSFSRASQPKKRTST